MRRQPFPLAGLLLLTLMACTEAAERPEIVHSPSDVPLCLAAWPPAGTGDARWLLIGWESGEIRALDRRLQCPPTPDDDAPTMFLTKLSASVTSLLVLPGQDLDAEFVVIAGTDTGEVVGLAWKTGIWPRPLWQYHCAAGVSSLVALGDVSGDGRPEVAIGGADQRVHVCCAYTGSVRWNAPLYNRAGTGYVSRILVAPDLNGDAFPDLLVRTWAGEVWALRGVDGETIWHERIDAGFTDALALSGDVDADACTDLLTGGNDGMVRCVSGRSGVVLWNCPLGSPVRDILGPDAADRSAAPACFAGTAAGQVHGLPLQGVGDRQPSWTASLGDVVRVLVSTGDNDGDGAADVAAGAENGWVVAFSGLTGRQLWRDRAGDTVRSLLPLEGMTGPGLADLAVAALDGSVAFLPVPKGPDDRRHHPLLKAGLAPTGRPTSRPSRPAFVPPAEPLADVPIILYHDVLPEALYRYAVRAEDFRAQMDLLKSTGFQCVSLDDVAAWLAGADVLPAHPICITFDGPYEGHHTWAAPILQERGMFAVSYITTDWIGTSNHADWHQIRDMELSGVMDIQNHTRNHPLLSNLEAGPIAAQLTGCSQAIADHLFGKIARHHAYPSGVESAPVRSVLAELNFRTATTTRPRHVQRGDDPLLLPRYTLKNDTTLAEFQRWLRLDPEESPPAGSR